jgi:hypothetical protein
LGFCQARDADGVLVQCMTQNRDLIAALDMVSDGSYLVFSWDGGLACNHIGTSTQSFYLPKDK